MKYILIALITSLLLLSCKEQEVKGTTITFDEEKIYTIITDGGDTIKLTAWKVYQPNTARTVGYDKDGEVNWMVNDTTFSFCIDSLIYMGQVK